MWRSRPSCWTEEALRLMRRMVVARHLFSSRAAKGIWRSRRSCWTEAPRLMGRVVLTGHLFTSRAMPGTWRSRPSCWTEKALRLMRRVQRGHDRSFRPYRLWDGVPFSGADGCTNRGQDSGAAGAGTRGTGRTSGSFDERARSATAPAVRLVVRIGTAAGLVVQGQQEGHTRGRVVCVGIDNPGSNVSPSSSPVWQWGGARFKIYLALRLMRRMLMARRLFTSRAPPGAWRSRPSCWTEEALRLMRRLIVGRHLFTTRAATGAWRWQPSCWTEEALRLMRRMVIARHLFTPGAAKGTWRSRPSCWTVVALLTSKSSGEADPTLKKFSSFCRSEVTTCFLTLHLRTRNDAGSASSSVALPFVVLSATRPLSCRK